MESGRIDHGLHANKAQLSLGEVVMFDDTIRTVMEMINTDETLVVVTADHSHSLTINGYPKRGNDIFGEQEKVVYIGRRGCSMNTRRVLWLPKKGNDIFGEQRRAVEAAGGNIMHTREVLEFSNEGK